MNFKSLRLFLLNFRPVFVFFISGLPKNCSLGLVHEVCDSFGSWVALVFELEWEVVESLVVLDASFSRGAARSSSACVPLPKPCVLGVFPGGDADEGEALQCFSFDGFLIVDLRRGSLYCAPCCTLALP